jgi:hypothetical protein
MSLHLAPCSLKAARHACGSWHYSKTVPAGKNRLIGVWEDDKFIGTVIFGLGVNRNIGKAFKLAQGEVVELVRVALDTHKAPVTKIIKVALLLLKKANPGIHLVISYADPMQGHEGVIYKAGNWRNLGRTSPSYCYRVQGELRHKRTFWGTDKLGRKKKPPAGAELVKTPGKIRFGYPLTKRGEEILSGGPRRDRGNQSRHGSSILTPPLQSPE